VASPSTALGRESAWYFGEVPPDSKYFCWRCATTSPCSACTVTTAPSRAAAAIAATSSTSSMPIAPR
jgi:hypothetical protein